MYKKMMAIFLVVLIIGATPAFAIQHGEITADDSMTVRGKGTAESTVQNEVEVETRKITLLDVAIHSEYEELGEEVNELIQELKETVAAYNEATKQGDIEAQSEYFKEVERLVSELQKLGIEIEIIENPVITITILGITVAVTITKKAVISFLLKMVAGEATTRGLIALLESRGGNICSRCEGWMKKGGFVLSTTWGYIVGKYGAGTLATILSSTPWKIIGCMAGFIARAIPACNNRNCLLHRHRRR